MVGITRDEGAPLLGRLEEQSLMTSLLDDVGARGQALVVRGEPGIGKSRLLSVCERMASERGMTVLSTTGVQSEANLPFAGLHQLFRPVRGRTSELRDVQRAALDAAFGLTDEAAPEHFRIAMAALDLVSEAASDAPVLLIVDDAQWLDPPTSDVLAFVARRIESDPIVLLAAIRDGYPSSSARRGFRSFISPVSTTPQRVRCWTCQLLDSRSRHGAGCCGRLPVIRLRCSSFRLGPASARTSQSCRVVCR